MTDPPTDIHLERDKALTVTWADGSTSTYPIEYLRRMSPSAEARQLREQLDRDPLAVLPSAPRRGGPTQGALTAEDAELVGNYAIRIRFSDGHTTGLYAWDYLREIDPERATPS